MIKLSSLSMCEFVSICVWGCMYAHMYECICVRIYVNVHMKLNRWHGNKILCNKVIRLRYVSAAGYSAHSA